MKKQEYIIRQIARTNKKNYENYVVTRIWHFLNDLDLKIVTQQYIRRPDGFALTDLYFPQLKCHIEIDEPFHEKHTGLDIKREADIVNATNHIILRIKVTEDIDYLHQQIDIILKTILELMTKYKMDDNFKKWDIENEYHPENYMRKGYLQVDDDVRFKRIVDACNCFGHNYKGYQRAWTVNKLNISQCLWFPKFYNNEEWNNRMNDDGTEIIELCMIKEKREKHFNRVVNEKVDRVTFPRIIDNLGSIMYQYRGVFRVIPSESSIENGVLYKKIGDRIEITKI